MRIRGVLFWAEPQKHQSPSHWLILLLIVCVHLYSYFCGGLQKTHLFRNRVRIGHLRSSKVDNLGTNEKRVCDFILVRHRKLRHILHHFRDTATYWLKNANLSNPTLSFGARPFSACSLRKFAVKLSREETRVSAL